MNKDILNLNRCDYCREPMPKTYYLRIEYDNEMHRGQFVFCETKCARDFLESIIRETNKPE